MAENPNECSTAVQLHLNIMQSVIQRMASNSANCKAWCITLVSAILVVVADKGIARYAIFAAIPTFLFFLLDAYYLALERCFRRSYNLFVGKVHAGSVASIDFYVVRPIGSLRSEYLTAIGSFSIWLFYAALAAMILVAQWVILAGK
jgi:hypothetical protein